MSQRGKGGAFIAHRLKAYADGSPNRRTTRAPVAIPPASLYNAANLGGALWRHYHNASLEQAD